MEKTFDEWFKELKELYMEILGWDIDNDSQDDWKDFYDDDYTPKEAINEELIRG